MTLTLISSAGAKPGLSYRALFNLAALLHICEVPEGLNFCMPRVLAPLGQDEELCHMLPELPQASLTWKGGPGGIRASR